METPRLLTDDMDIRDTELSMYHGNNGDYYICLKETKRGEIVKLDTRIAMSGGNATPEIRQAVSSLFKALLGQKAETREEQLTITDVSGSFSAMDMQEFAVYVLASWNSGEKKKTDEYLDEWVANDR
jgi:hypothetical protein